MSPILQEERVKKNRVRELWQQGKPAVQGWCATGNRYIAEMRMLTTTTAETLKTFCDALS